MTNSSTPSASGERSVLNSAPVATDDAYSTDEDKALSVDATGVLTNDTDRNSGDTLSAVLVSGPSHVASFALNADGSFSYTPAANYNGTDSFTYKAKDPSGAESNTAKVTLTVNEVNDAPRVEVAAATACGTNDRCGTITLSVADVDHAVADLTLAAGNSSNTALVPTSNLVFSGTGASRTLTAPAFSGKTGTATLTVTVSDGTDTSTVALTLKAGGNSNDTLAGTSPTNTLSGTDILLGQNGDDTLRGMGGKDLLCGGRGNDRLSGGAGADRFEGGPGTDRATDFTPSQGDTKDATIP
jgi:VCBS repeat-containing protein